jgi:tRNA (guanine9-N1)-methyltransferase
MADVKVLVEDEHPLTNIKDDTEENGALLKEEQDVADDGETDGTLSKRARKKLLKRQQWLDTKQERRAKEKEKRKMKMEKRKEDGVFEESRNVSRKRLKEAKMAASACKVGVVFDLQFEALMSQRDLGKTLKQIMKCYSLNRRQENPLQLYMTSFEGRSREDMAKNQGFENWDMNYEKQRYDAALPKERLVYLSSESENVLTELEQDKFYVIGGLVDHNAHKGLCHREAAGLGVRTARLPIDEFVEMRTRKVLTVNHVFEILAAVARGCSWKEAFMATIPDRKGAAVREEGEAEGDSEINNGEDGIGDAKDLVSSEAARLAPVS